MNIFKRTWTFIAGETAAGDILAIDKKGYPETILKGRPDINLTKEDENSVNIAKENLLQEMVNCRELMSPWMGSGQVVKDCEKHLKSAHNKIVKYNKEDKEKKADTDDLRDANDELLEIRQRVIQAWASKHSKPLVSVLFGYHLVIMAACAFLLIYYGLLPGQTSRLISTNINVVILFSSFLVGAIGGLFDGLFALKTNYSNRLFDEGHFLWYFSNAILGGILGAVVFGAILAGLLSTTGQGVAATSTNTTVGAAAALQSTTGTASTTMAAFILVVAFIAGLKQRMVLTFLNRIANSVFGGGDSGSTTTTTTST
jgi:hypothetical protein